MATITSTGQITLPTAFRAALGVDCGSQVALELDGAQVILTRPSAEPESDPAIAQFLRLLEADIRSGTRVTELPTELAESMLSALALPTENTLDIEGEVSI